MSESVPSNHNRSVSIGGAVNYSAIITGDSNTASIQVQKAALTEPGNVDIQAEVATLREILIQLQPLDQRKSNVHLRTLQKN